MNDYGCAIAVIGMSGRFPGASDVRQYWKNLCNGVESITFFDDEHLDIKSWEYPKNQTFVNAGAVLENIDHFDAALFGSSGAEAEMLDPQQRVFLQCAWEALEDAGYNWREYEGLIGVYAGASQSQYFLNNLYAKHKQNKLHDPVQAMLLELANQNDYLATRVSYKLNLSGPSLNIQTACSTSLVAVHTAIQSLISGDTDIALAGGVNIKVPHKSGYLYRETFVNSKDGHCYAFDDRATGTVFGNGAGIVVLKLLSEAIEDGDNIHAVIRGSAINNDGSGKAGFTAPSVAGQQAVIEEALMVANVDPATIGYVETHGTGTPLGDPIEIAGLSAAFKNMSPSGCAEHKCAIGSVKTNIGHLEEAAGVAGLIKTIMALKKRQIPASLNFKKANPKIDFSKTSFFVNTELNQWPESEYPLRAGVSSFGIGGTNAHVVLEKYQKQ